MASISSLGVGSGFLNNDLLDDIVKSSRAPIERRLSAERQETEAKLSAFGKFQSAVSSLEAPASALTDPTALRSFKGESSDDAVGVSVDSSEAQKGSFTVDVNQLAQAQALASGTYADRDATAVGTGDLTFEVGGETKTITLDSDNNTLDGLAGEINDADMGVNASILNTGDGYRLVMNAAETGEANSISITANGDAALDDFNYNSTTKNLTQTRAAQDAELTVSGVSITRSTNTVEGVIDGVTFNLSGTTDTPADVDITQDLEEPTKQVQALVDAFNKVQSTANSLTKYDTEAQQGSILSGDPAVRNVMNQLKRDFGQIVSGLENAPVRSLADVGITTDFNTGKLEFDTAKFKEKLEQNPDDVTALFANQGRTSDTQIEFVQSTGDTEVGEYDVNVSSVATRGSYTADSALADNTTIDGSNDTFSIELNNGNEAQITLTQGTYATPQDLLNEIQTQVENNDAIQSSDASLEVGLTASDELKFTSSTYGSDSTVQITEANNTLGLSARTGQAGTDVEGTIGGEQAEGDGQVLFLKSDQGDASGIQLRVRGGATGARGTVSYIEGIGNTIEERISQLQSSTGALQSREETFQNELDNISEERQELNERMTALRERLSSKFAAADSRISQFQKTGSFLEQQLSAMSGGGN